MDKLWVDKYRPKKLQQLNYHHSVSQVLSQLATKNDFPHMLFYGPNGAGKKTRVLAFLNEVYGSNIYKLKCEQKSFKLENSTTIQCNIISSNYHIQITPADNQNQDKHVIQRVLKQLASTQVIQTKNNHKGFKVVIINQAERLTKQAQAALRRTMEKYISACRIILICEQLNRLIAPIRSRCLNIRISAPKKIQIVDALQSVCKKQCINVPAAIIQGLAEQSKGNLRAAILQLQMWKQLKPGNSVSSLEGLMSPWRKQVFGIVKDITVQQTPNKLKSIRDKFYQLLVNCIQGALILQQMVNVFINLNLNQTVLVEIIHHAAKCESGLNLGSKAIFHLESFAAHCMLVLKEQNQRMKK